MNIHIKNIIYLYVIFCFYFSTAYAPSCGLENVANDCFMNATIQAFFTIKPLNDYLNSLPIKEDSIPGKFCATIQAMKQAGAQNQISNASVELRRYLGATLPSSFGTMATGSQEDAEEMFNKILTSLRETDYQAIAAPAGSITNSREIQDHITNIFQRSLDRILICQSCNQEKRRHEHELDFKIKLTWHTTTTFSENDPELEKLKKIVSATDLSLETLIKAHATKIEIITDYSCDLCNQKNTTAIKTTEFTSFPAILSIPFNRYKTNYFSIPPQSIKIENVVTFPLQLNLTQYLKNKEWAQFQLIAIILQTGGTGAGHYFGYFKDPEDPRKWYYANDSTFMQVEENKITEICQEGQAYFLIYEKLPAPTPPVMPATHTPTTRLQAPLEILKEKLISVKNHLGTLQNKLTDLKDKIGALKKKLLSLAPPSPTYFLSKPTILPQHFRSDKTALNALAITGGDGVGYKVANLEQLKPFAAILTQTLQEQGLNNFNLRIPDFIAIKSSVIKAFLKTKGLDLGGAWRTILTSISEVEKTTAKQNKQFPEKFLTNLNYLQQRIITIFKDEAVALRAKSDQDAQESFKMNFDADESIIKFLASKTSRLMVRSSGKEDTDEVANAGGNESVANVPPTFADVVEAMGIKKSDEGESAGVVSSYFGEKSFKQRLGLGDPDIFDEEPLTPVLIQEMIGEPSGGAPDIANIPSVGVMFTEEAEGGIYQSPGAQTTGITIIQSSYGHNEGVVNGIVAIDTYLIDNLGSLVPIIRPKKFRLIPSDSGTIKKDNPQKMIIKPTLTPEIILYLKLIAKALEEYYAKPMDIEFVYEPQTKTICIVQARPITYKKGLLPPSYIINPEAQGQENYVAGITIGAAGGSLRFIVNKNQIIINNTLKEALDTFINSAAPDDITGIITGTMAPATSHEATTFRGEGKPVMYVSHIEKIEEWFNHGAKVVISPQQGLIIRWQGTENNLDELNQQNKTAMGWINYPIPKQYSLIHKFSPQKQLSKESIKNLMKDVSFSGEIDDLFKVKQTEPFKKTIFSYLDEIKTKDGDVALKALTSFLIICLKGEEWLISKANKIKSLSKLVIDYHALNVHLYEYAKNLKSILQTNPPLSPLRLFYARILESMINQQFNSEECRNSFSYDAILKTAQKELSISGQSTIKDPYLIQFEKLLPLAFSNELQNHLKDFFAYLTNIKELDVFPLKGKVAWLIKELNEFNVLPLWLHTSFVRYYKDNANPKETAEKLLKEFIDIKDFVGTLRSQLNALHAFNTNAFETRESFKRAWEEFKNEFCSYFSSKDFIEKFKGANSLGQIIALEAMNTFVEFFDQLIKTTKASKHFSDKEKIIKIKILLQSYFDLLISWLGILDENELKLIAPPGNAGAGRRVSDEREEARKKKFEELYKKYFTTWLSTDNDPSWRTIPSATNDAVDSKNLLIQFLSIIQELLDSINENFEISDQVLREITPEEFIENNTDYDQNQIINLLQTSLMHYLSSKAKEQNIDITESRKESLKDEWLTFYQQIITENKNQFSFSILIGAQTLAGDCPKEEIYRLMENNYLKTQLFGTPGFNAASFQLGSKCGLDSNFFPQCLEDIFTTIHQNLLMLIARLTAKHSKLFTQNPQIIQDFQNAIRNKESDNNRNYAEHFFDKQLQGKFNAQLPTIQDRLFLKKINLIGIKITYNDLIYTYNIPFRTHSCIFSVKYNRKTQTAFLEAEIMFANLDDERKKQLRDYLEQRNKLNTIESCLSKNERSIIFGANIEASGTKNTPEFLLEDLEILGILTYIYY